MKIALVTDAWEPQVNGVVRTLQSVRAILEGQGHEIMIVSPDRFYSLPCPTYPEIRLAVVGMHSVGELLADFAPHAIHLATEGPICLAARRWCLKRGFPFTTAYHTQFPDYVSARSGVPAEWIWRYIRWFHTPAQAILASTPSIRKTLVDHGLSQVSHWGRGVDLRHFHDNVTPEASLAHLPRPLQLYVGRVAVEKNLEAFLESDHPGTKVVVGDGPARGALEPRYPEAIFLGSRFGADLAAIYSAADVFVFPSRTDTFGLVMIEALACGTPVAAFPVSGPVDVLIPKVGAMAERLEEAIAEALLKDRADCAAYGRSFTWEASAEQFLGALAPIEGDLRAA
ncbi:glycosyltransferase family 4 protein [Stakelama pacifica]|uniref:Glycosyltransferase involved in cell wall biosynthesis n=1 Tax=Stakelama pacifica TaxID=517720 RepID=A0A4V3BTU4_9SPHN|nr:glycosyltransferase family 1 protein [Stakelama pacifica]TDN84518.1 glycosyltransferase involved in cell wall biosynthesis [Stakelama pacifica]GGO93574.1 glycosyl transferase [Stakelama pacifica]